MTVGCKPTMAEMALTLSCVMSHCLTLLGPAARKRQRLRRAPPKISKINFFEMGHDVRLTGDARLEFLQALRLE